MKQKAINADERIFLVKFAYTIRSAQFLIPQNDLFRALEEHDPGRGIAYLKEFDPYTLRFKHVSKRSLLFYFSYDQEVREKAEKLAERL